MIRIKSRILALLFIFLCCSAYCAELPRTCKIDGIERIKQLYNYCGPACMASVLNHFGKNTTQNAVGRYIYDAPNGATHGADMLLYARDQGFVAYSWNSSIKDVKRFVAAGLPVIALQQNSFTDTSGHYRVITGYDDYRSVFYVMDPYYDPQESSYTDTERLWSKWGYWALVIIPKEKDTFKDELDTKNTVLHMDLCYGEYKRKNYKAALAEANAALKLEPTNSYTLDMVSKIKRAMAGAGAK